MMFVPETFPRKFSKLAVGFSHFIEKSIQRNTDDAIILSKNFIDYPEVIPDTQDPLRISASLPSALPAVPKSWVTTQKWVAKEY